MRDAFVRALMREAETNRRLVLITGDLGFGVLRPFWEKFPDQFVNAGIAEQSMAGIASGLAATGRTVLIYSIGNFPTLRCLEQIRNDCAYHERNVKIVCVGGGFVYGSLGMSHHATEDIAVMRALPGVTCFAPGDPAETEAVTEAMLHTPGTCYLRLGRGNEVRVHETPVEGWSIPKAIDILPGNDTVILSTGGMLPEAVRAAGLLKEKGISAGVISFPCIKPLDTDTIREIAGKYRMIVTAEEHNKTGGFGSAVCEAVAEMPERCVIRRIGLEDTYSTVVGSQKYLRKVYGMDAEAICEKTAAWLTNG